MDSFKMAKDIDDALESTAGVPLGTDTVAIWDWKDKIYGVYVRDSNSVWWIEMTSLTLDGLLEKG